MQRKHLDTKGTTKPLLVLTRSVQQSRAFIADLKKQTNEEFEYLIAPLIRVDFCSPQKDVPDNIPIVFTSTNGLRAFVDSGILPSAGVFCVGETTCKLAEKYGLKIIARAQTANELVSIIDRPIYYARGQEVSLDIVSALEARNIAAMEGVFYAVTEILLTKEAVVRMLNKRILLPVFSQRSALRLQDEFVDLNVTELQFVAISEKVAEVISTQFGIVAKVASAPTRFAMIESLRDIL